MIKRLGIFAVLLLAIGSAVFAPGAHAAEKIFYLNKKPLLEGKLPLLKAADGVAYKFQRGGGTPSFNVECKGMVLGETSYIYGGKPGYFTLKMEWTGCTGSMGGKSCSNIGMKTPSLVGQIAELNYGPGKGFAAVLLYPLGGFFGGEELIRFEGLCGGVPDVRIIEGTVVAEPSSQCNNLTEVELMFPGIITEVNVFSGTTKVSTTMEGSPVSITGSTAYFLFFSPKWGIC